MTVHNYKKTIDTANLNKMINVSPFLVQLLTFFFILYFTIIALFFLVRAYLTTFTFVILFSSILFIIFSLLILLFPFIIFKQNFVYLSLDGTINLLSSINNNLSFLLFV